LVKIPLLRMHFIYFDQSREFNQKIFTELELISTFEPITRHPLSILIKRLF
jgi:hypothetical protein